ncbi:YdeI/OmpD-associated family protein [Pontivivens insulae]|uniref:DUF1905 domain-containing protein n=1 Tax=Pontivivens insulae TaxID=1639689 RepID=A0A2R8A9R3_9RHOB|nr:YdeI/OmpD-associated family protein [Pontivivens insulae]RED12865.1 uncharacterized protein DUF1905 [Pontivivens insulae]SPF28956.1 hypothetical protein POI8812_01259 [Pontivivens insulae]
MSDWVAFEGEIVAMEWGNSTYTVLPIPDEVIEDPALADARRVEVELNDHPFNMALTKAPPIEQIFVYTGKDVLAQAGIAPGDQIDVRMRLADPDQVDLPDDVARALIAAGLLEDWEALSPGKRRGLLHGVQSAKRAETRAKRIAKLIEALAT